MAEGGNDSSGLMAAFDRDSGAFDSAQVIGGRFTLLRKLGSGGYGTVWLARDSATRADVALKILHPHLRENVLAVERFSREARVLERLDHPNVARPVAWGVEDGALYLALELVDGVTLKDELADRATHGKYYAMEQIARFVFEIGGALAHAHALGIVHRDLKPANIMLVKKGGELGVKVLDFGIAKVTAPTPGDETTIGRLLGSWLYMAPEQVRGESVDHRSDIFALGTTLFEMITLKSAFARDDGGHPMPVSTTPDLGHGINNRYNLLRRIVLEARPRPSDSRAGLSPAIDRVVLRAMEFDPQARFQSAAELVRAFEAAIDPAKLSTTMRPPQINAALARAETASPADLRAASDRELIERLEGRTDPIDADTDSSGGAPAENTAATEIRAEPVTPPRSTRIDRASPSAADTAPPAVPDTLVRPPSTARASQVRAQQPRATLLAALIVLLIVLGGLAVTVQRLFFVEPIELTVETPRPVPRDPGIVQRAEVPAPQETPAPEEAPLIAPPPAKKPPRPEAQPQPQPQPRPRPHAELVRMLEEIRAHPGDLERITRLSDRISAAADKISDRAARTPIKRCATASAISGDVQDVASCLAMLEAALKE